MPAEFSKLKVSAPLYFKMDSRLEKGAFLIKFMNALKHTYVNKNPTKEKLLYVNQKVAEQAWKNYQIICSYYDKNQVVEDNSSSFRPTTDLEDFKPIYYSRTSFSYNSRCWNSATIAAKNWPLLPYLSALQELLNLKKLDKSKCQFLINLPMFTWSDAQPGTEQYDQVLIHYFNNLSVYIASTKFNEVVELIKMGADINQYSPLEGNNPLLLAISKGWNHQDPHRPDPSPNFYPQKEIIKLLIQNKADVNAIHLANGMTPLHIACLRGDDPELISLLLESGANPKSRDDNGATPIELLNLSYNETQAIIYRFTTAEDRNFANLMFGCNLPEHRSATATLPSREERQQNQLRIKEILISLMERTTNETAYCEAEEKIVPEAAISHFGPLSPDFFNHNTSDKQSNESKLKTEATSANPCLQNRSSSSTPLTDCISS